MLSLLLPLIGRCLLLPIMLSARVLVLIVVSGIRVMPLLLLVSLLHDSLHGALISARLVHLSPTVTVRDCNHECCYDRFEAW